MFNFTVEDTLNAYFESRFSGGRISLELFTIMCHL